MGRLGILVIHTKAFLGAYLNAISALNTGQAFDAPGGLRFIHLNGSCRAASLAHAAEDAILDGDANASSGSLEVLFLPDWISDRIRSMEHILKQCLCHSEYRHNYLNSAALAAL